MVVAANKADPPNPAMASLLHAGRHWRGVGDPRALGKRMSNCYVEFTHAGGPILKRLDEFVKSVQDSKNLPAPQADKMLIEHFNAEQLSTFWWPSNNEAAETKKSWGEVPVFRVVAQSKPKDWDIYSLFDVIRQS